MLTAYSCSLARYPCYAFVCAFKPLRADGVSGIDAIQRQEGNFAFKLPIVMTR